MLALIVDSKDHGTVATVIVKTIFWSTIMAMYFIVQREIFHRNKQPGHLKVMGVLNGMMQYSQNL